MNYTQEQVLEALKTVKHPGAGLNVVEMGAVKNIDISEQKVSITLSFKKPNDPFARSVSKACNSAVKAYLGEIVEIEVITSDFIEK